MYWGCTASTMNFNFYKLHIVNVLQRKTKQIINANKAFGGFKLAPVLA